MGGTNFGFTGGTYISRGKIITSYDYDAPVDESGKPTKKFYIIQNILLGENSPSKKLLRKPYEYYREKFIFKVFIPTLNIYKKISYKKYNNITSSYPLEKLANCKLPTINVNQTLKVYAITDEAIVYIDGKAIAKITLENKLLTDWKIYLFDIGAISTLNINPFIAKQYRPESFYNQSFFAYGEFKSNKRAGNYLDLGKCFKQGYVFINGFNIGYYNNMVPPQRTLYVPPSAFRKYVNKIHLFEYESINVTDRKNPFCEFEFIEGPIWV
ncbi:hypothetical protein HZS_8068 [Henneguya salminicola]|nr:hypothetical protein HZS_8068 [Henneguya salminicola]